MLPFCPISMLKALLLTKFKNCRSFCIFSGCWQYGRSALAPSDIIKLLFHMIASTDIRIKSFNLNMDSMSKFEYYSDNSLDCKRMQIQLDNNHEARMSSYWIPNFLFLWSKLKELQLNHEIQKSTALWTLNIFCHAPNVRRLTLDFGPFCWDGQKVMSELSSFASIYHNLRDPVFLKSLPLPKSFGPPFRSQEHASHSHLVLNNNCGR